MLRRDIVVRKSAVVQDGNSRSLVPRAFNTLTSSVEIVCPVRPGWMLAQIRRLKNGIADWAAGRWRTRVRLFEGSGSQCSHAVMVYDFCHGIVRCLECGCPGPAEGD